PQPDSYAALSRNTQRGKSGSTLELYRAALALRKQLALGEGSFDWMSLGDVLSYQNSEITISHNFGTEPQKLAGDVLIRSGNEDGPLRPGETAWTR
ncbi:MAG: alpha-amylase, partial [Aquiluna sp.]